MKRLIFTLTAVVTMSACLVGCGNVDLFDTNLTYDYAIVRWPDGSVKRIDIKQWRDYEGEQIQLIGKDGKIYLISSINSVLVREN